ncbi:hypothetical protein GCM10010371_25140 [Streptomyces subrutilus]|uniref:Uncharacterized protein n=1 Tax=Streptomyces subrutilus TaxID=36818 RepID=A0A918V2X8_9ACTN|nr:hypothetical protein [Streptomyces subrutilus]GGZ64508.1 hypothetical protein GCM10010371_25140 [Streptomyces subrutilus]
MLTLAPGPPLQLVSGCRHGDEGSHDAAAAGWMHYRGLDLVPLSDDIRSRL